MIDRIVNSSEYEVELQTSNLHAKQFTPCLILKPKLRPSMPVYRRAVGDVVGLIRPRQTDLVEVVHQDAHDFAEAQCHDGQIVAAQLEHRCAKHQAGKSCEEGPKRQQHPERIMQIEVADASNDQVAPTA